MVRTNLKGLTKVKKKLADGSVREYFYAWRGGPLLKGDDDIPLSINDPMLQVAFADAHRERKQRPAGTLSALIGSFRSSSEFKSISDKTKRAYTSYLDAIDDKFGTMSLEVVQDIRSRGKFKSWRDTMSDTPRKADYAWTTLARVLSVAKDRGEISTNVCERGGRLYEANRSESIWLAPDITKFLSHASDPLKMAMLLALWTGQRQGDLLKVTWHAYDGSSLRIRQGKGGARVKIPISGIVKRALDAARKEGMGEGHILRNTRGKKWTEDGFRTSWGKASKKAGIGDLTFHDLRGTSVTRLALAGCSTSQIASFTGHALKNVDAILETHYLGGRFELAEQAAVKLVAHQKT